MDPDTALSRLDAADACHDEDPVRAAALLREADAAQLPADRLPAFAFLVNHVLGERFGAWDEACARHASVLRAAGAAPPAVLLRQAAAAAQGAGNAVEAARLCAAFAAATGSPLPMANDVIALTVAMYRVPGLAPDAAAACALAALSPLRDAAGPWQQAGALDTAVAACANNLASGLVERPPDELAHGPLRGAVQIAADVAERFWLRAGNWVHHERAAYLRAMAGNAIGDAAQARGHAQRALALIDANDADDGEKVDRAFVELEHAHACRTLGLTAEAHAAQARADAIAAGFGDAFLDSWFARRRAALALLAAPAAGSG